MGKGAPDNKYPAAQAIWLVMLMLCSSMLPFIPPALEAEGKVANTGSSTPTITLVRGFQIIETSPLIQNSSIEEWEMYPSPPNGIALNDGTDMKPLDGDRSHTCAILDNGSMACWGQNSHHELGDQTTCSQYVNNTDCPFKWGKNSPVYVNFSDQVLPVSVDTGYERTCAIMSDHSVRCWGREYAPGPNNVSLTSIFNPSAITVGEESVCIVLTDGNVQCLGKNGYGQLGNSSRVGNNWNSTFADVSLPVNRSAVRIASEYMHACALLDNGSVACWGDNYHGQLGDWSVTGSTNNSVFARLPQNRTAVDIDVGNIHSCAELDNGSVFCWGYGGDGRLGNGIHSAQGYPNGTFVSLPENRTVSQLDLSSSNACALLDNGSILCWGDNKGLTPTIQPLPLNTTALRVEATGDATCAVLANHTTNCWVGFSNSAIDRGVLGDGTWVPKNSTSSLPVNFSIGRTVDLSLLAGSLRGVPSNLQSLTNYTVWGNTSSGGSQSLNFSIEVLPALDYGNSTISLTRNTTMTPRTPVFNGGPYNLSIWPTLPSGLHFNSTNGTIWGTPSINLTQQTFLVTVSNSSGSDNIALQIGVVDISPMVTYASLNHTFVRGFNISTVHATQTGGNVESGVVSPNLPEGLHLMNPHSGIADLALGADHTCAIRDEGALYCWGDAGQGRLGIGQLSGSFAIPTRVNFGPGRVPVSVSANGQGHTCAILDDGSLKCWGSNSYGQLGIGSNTKKATPQNVDLGTGRTAVQVSVGWTTTCAILDNGVLKCWGDGDYGKLGIGNTTSHNTPQAVSLPTGRTAESVSSGGQNTCAILDNGSLMCWGMWTHSSASHNTPQFVNLGLGITAAAISTGTQYSCAILDNSSLKCWGSIAGSSPSPTPTIINLGTGRTAMSVSTQGAHSCVILDNGELKCWGYNNYGQLGINSTTNSAFPAAVNLGPGRTAIKMSTGNDHSCASLDDGSLKCWGKNNYGQLGNGNYTQYNYPVQVEGMTGPDWSLMGAVIGKPRAVAPATTYTIWANNSVGNHSTNMSITVAQALDYGNGSITLARNMTMTPWTPIMNGGPYNLSIWPTLPPGLHFNSTNGTVWGTPSINITQQSFFVNVSNSSGSDTIPLQISVGDIAPMVTYASLNHTFVRGFNISTILATQTGGHVESGVSSPELPNGLHLMNPLSGVSAVELGYYHSCAILDDGSLKCWGHNGNGQLGIGSYTEQSTPQLVSLGAGRTAVEVSAGDLHTCAVLDDGSLKCWGSNNNGQLGDGSSTNSNTPVAVSLPSGRTAVEVASGELHTCAMLDDSSLKCWGYNGWGQLGNGNNYTDQNSPQSVNFSSGRTVTQIAAGERHTCAILDNGSINCWGGNGMGQLGIGSVANYRNTPQWISIGSGRTAVSIVAGGHYTCAVLDNGALKCWGANSRGQLGLGSNVHRETPQSVDVGTSRTVVEVIAGGEHTCAILDDESLYCWGSNNVNQLGIGTNYGNLGDSFQEMGNYLISVDLGQNLKPIGIATGGWHTCAILDDGSLKCWGGNNDGQLGLGTVNTYNNNTPNLVEGLFGPDWNLMGSISGTPTVVAPWTNYTLWANNSVGNHSTNMSITVLQALDYGNGSISLARNVTMSTATPIITGGPYTLSISPSLPSGLSFNNTTGVISGTPLFDQSTQTYYISVSNSTGSDEIEITIGIADVAPILNYAETNLTYVRGFEHPDLEPILTGGQVATWEISPALSAGLIFNTTSGIISGVPTVATLSTNYTIWANNSLGISNAVISITVLPGVDYPSSWVNLTRNVTMNAFIPTININDINLLIYPALPLGLYFDNATGTVSGTSLIPWQSLEYTVSLWNSSGYDTFNFTLFVAEILPNVIYEHSNHDELVGFAIEPIIASNDAGTVHQWGISPSLPAGLDFLTYAVGQTFSAGQSSTCAIYSDDTLRCWGANDMGQLGDGNVISSSTPVLVNFSDGATPVEVAVGGEHACAIMNDGSVRCWGRNDVGQVGRGTVCIYGSFADGCNGNFGITASSTVLLPNDLNATSISAGISHTCALMENGAVYCWGSNSNLQNGDGTSDDLATPAIASLPVGRYAVSLGVGNTHSCAVLDNGSAICWGANSFGQLGDGSAGADATYQFVQLPAGRSIVEIRGGGAHTCVLLDAGDVACWGRNTHGQLGDGTTIGKITPLIITLPGTLSATSIALGNLHSCALFDSGEIACWGSNQNGLIGGGGQYNATPSMLVLPDGLSLLSLSAGEGHTCGLTSTSRLVCIGDNGVGQLGDGSQINQPSLDYVVSIQGAIITTPHLPVGTIYGTPKTILSSTTYTIYANNSIGQTNFPLTLSIQIPLEYSTNSLILLRDRVMTVETPNIANGEFSLLTITPTLIEGITLDATTGVLSGIPLYNSTLTNYTITLSNSSGFYSIAISIVIYEPAANISYLAAPFSFTRGVDIGGHTPVVEGGVIEFWQIEPSLPQGLIFTEGMISGTSLVNLSTTTFRVWGNNSGGVGWIDIQITILEPAPILTLQTYELTLTRGESELNLSVTNLGGMVSNWSISPALPAGLIFTDGRITGVPLVNLSTTTYVLSSENSGGQHSISFNITINEPLPNIEYDPSQITITRGEIFDMIVAYDTGGMIESWTITPALPSGLMFSDGTISGLSAVNSTTITYTITAMNSGGLASWIITIEILEPAPLITYSNNTLQLTKGKPMNSLVPSNDGGLVATWSISPALPAGLFFDSGSGVISGSPLVTSQATVYTIIATSNGGESTFTIIIEIRDPLPEFSLPLTYLRLTEGVVMPQLAPIPSGVVITGWSLTTDSQGLPSGLQFSATTGVISGTPLLASEAIKVTIIATNGGGQVFRNLTIVVLADYDGDAIPDVNDEDDDNDGFSDSKEKKEGTDPLNEESVPVEGFEIIVPGTSVSLGAWDILGVLSGVPLITWLMFSLVTRNGRTQRFTVQLKEAKTREEVEEIAERYGHALMIKLIGPHQGMRLERIRMEKDASLKEQDNVNPVEELQVDAEPILTLDQTSVLEEAMKEDDLDTQRELQEDENSVVESTPAIDLKGIPDESGFEWTNLDGVQWYRVSGSGDDWIKWSS